MLSSTGSMVGRMTETLDTTTPSVNGVKSPAQRTDRMRAAVTATQRIHGIPVTLPLVGEVHLPSADELGFLAGIGALAAVGALEWPVALILCSGRVLSHVHRWRSLQAFGDALEHA